VEETYFISTKLFEEIVVHWLCKNLHEKVNKNVGIVMMAAVFV